MGGGPAFSDFYGVSDVMTDITGPNHVKVLLFSLNVCCCVVCEAKVCIVIVYLLYAHSAVQMCFLKVPKNIL